MDLGLDGRAVVITGASRGLGWYVARRLAAENCALAICARGAEPLHEAARRLRDEYGVPVHAEAVDVTDHDRLTAFVERSAETLGGLHGLVVNAGGGRGGLLDASTPQDWAAVFDVNVVHAATAVRAAAPHLAGGGSAVLISSISGWKPAPSAQYAAAKAAMIHMSASLARELGPRRIRVNAVSPGSLLIPGGGWDRFRAERPDEYQRFLAEFPTGELVDPDDVAAVVAFLLSARARAVSGANIPVDAAQNAPSALGY
ncbi:SDR family oxidoreductase [Micromonospora sp. NPDC049559]|uniref:SDR family NAD(P)-dependent oxidoreductase n=1 Tax=Micromonospora sp. NPDC049559 TaxID=3155923 RepID=UPI00342A530D